MLAGRDLQLALALTAVGNVGIVTVFTYIAPLLTKVSGFSAGAIPALLLVYGAGAVIGNFLGGWLADRALMPSLTGLLAVLAVTLALFWLVSGVRVPAAILTFVIGILAFAIIPGMQTRVVATASAAPTLAVAVNASGFQLAVAFVGVLGGWVITDALTLEFVGVLRGLRGRGVGRALLERVIADAAGSPVHLTTAHSSNPGLYQRFGWRETGRVGVGGLVVVAMLRPGDLSNW